MKTIHFTRLLLVSLCLLLSPGSHAGPDFWIDVREHEAYQQGHVEGAINIPHDRIAEQISAVTTDKDAEIYLYCRSGRRAGQALEALQAMGYSNASNVGGIKDAMRLDAISNP